MLIKGIDALDQSGFSVSAAGDVDGDGRDDVLIGAPYAGPDGIGSAGETYLVFGSALEAAGAGSGVIDLASLVASDGVLIKGVDTGDQSGFSVSHAGDVDGDGRDDILIGADEADPDGKNIAGETYLVFGSALESAASTSGEIDLGGLVASGAGVLINGIDVGDRSGYSVSNAGDVDGDGRDDVLIGALWADQNSASNAGETYLVFGSALTSTTGEIDLGGLAPAEGVLLKGIGLLDSSGVSVSSAGDVDGDGRDDILIGASSADPDGDNNAGETYLVFGSALTSTTDEIDLGGLAPAEGVLIKGIDLQDSSGISVSNAGDVDGDGRDDILIGASGADPGGDVSAGETYLVFGSALEAAKTDTGVIDLDGLAASGNGVVIEGRDGFSGLSVSSAGDVDGDGRDDILVGAPRADFDGKTDAGETYLVFGSALEAAASLAVPGVIDLDGLAPTHGVLVKGINAGDQSGRSVSGAGDVDGDGRDDILIGAPFADPDSDLNAGETYLVSGALLEAEKSLDGVIDLADGNLLPPSPGQTALGVLIKGPTANDSAGETVSNAGDVDGDGRDDVLVGVLRAGGGGATYLVFGSALEAAADDSREIDLLDIAASEGVLIGGSGPFTRVSGAGDIDGDGRDDILIGAFRADVGGVDNAGEAYLVFGSALEAAAEAAASNTTAEIDLASLTADQGVLLTGFAEDTFVGWSISNAGDVNGDGRDDILLGSYFGDPGGRSSAGESYLVFGSALESAVAAAGSGTTPTIDLADIVTNNQGVRIEGAAAFDLSGRSVSNAGDVDGDGRDDILIGAVRADAPGNTDAGVSYLIFGSALDSAGVIDLANIVTTGAGVVINGADVQDESGNPLSSAGDVDGDGRDDLLIAATGVDLYGARDGAVYVVFGSAVEATAATGGSGAIDLGSLAGAGDGILITGLLDDDTIQREQQVSVSSAGDVDGDGLDDILIGSSEVDPDEKDEAGESYLIFGAALLAEKTAGDRTLDLTALDRSQGVLIKGIAAGDKSGTSVSGAGDVDGDGRDDILIGAEEASPDGRSEAGEAYVLFGSALAAEKQADGVIDLAQITATGVPPTATNLDQTVPYAEDPGGDVALGDIVVSDSDIGETITATLTLADPAAGALTTGSFGSATSTYDPGSGVWSVSGSVADVNAALAAVAFTPTQDFDIDSSITVRIRDAAGTGPADGTITLDVTPQNDEPTATNLDQMLSFSADDASVALDDIVVSDPDTGETITAALTLSDPNGGSLTTGTFGSATSVFNASTGVWSVTGSVADVNAALAAVAFIPDANLDQDLSIATLVRDAADTGPAAGEIELDFTRTNVAATATNLTQTVGYVEDAANVALNDIVVTDPDPGEEIIAVLTLNNLLAGALTTGTFGAATSTYNAATGVWEVTGSVADVNAALAAVAFLPAADFDTDTTITTRVADSLDAGPQPGSITLDVTPQDDPAVVTGDSTGTVTEGDVGDTETASGTLTITDVDTGDTPSFADVAGTMGDNGFGAFTLVSGTWTYTLDQAAVQFLDTGESVVDTTTFTATDNTTQQITITIDGTNEDGFLDEPVVFAGGEAGDQSGFSVSSAGDIDGDGLDDILIGSPGVDGPGAVADAGAVYLVLGAAIEAAAGAGEFELGGLVSGAGVLLRGVSAGDESGTSVSRAGDVDGDGRDDIVIGAPYADSGGATTAGNSYLLFGAALEAAAAGTGEIDLASLSPTEGVVLRGADQADQSGLSVAGAGDVNGDGLDDILIGAPLADEPGAAQAGKAYLVYGASLAAEKAADGIIELDDVGASAGVRINGVNTSDLAGFAVSGAGDIDGDGNDDILIGAYLADLDPGNPDDEGVTYLVFGSVLQTAGTLNLVDLEADEAVQIRGADVTGFSGRAVASLGDVDGNGRNDILIGAPGVATVGETYLVFGEALLAAASDDGVLHLADLVGDGAGVVLRGIDPDDNSGLSVSSAGDVDGDGLADVLIGALRADQPGGKENAGEVYLVFGSALANAAAGPGVLDLDSLAASDGVLVKGVDAGDQAGRSVSTAGDVDGDGLDDVLIGAPLADTNPDDAGETYLLSGARLSAEKTDDGVIDLADDEGAGGGVPGPIGGNSGTVFVIILGRAAVGSTLTAVLVGGNLPALSQISYSWQIGEQEVGTGRTFDVTADEVGRSIKVVVSYTDAGGERATVQSEPTQPVIDVVDGTDGNDILTVTIADTVVNGGDGEDTVQLPFFVTAYSLEDQGGGKVTGVFGDQVLELNDVELLEFGTGFQTTISIEEVISGAAQEQLGKLSDLYLAFFGRAPDIEGLEYWQEVVLEAGLDLLEISEFFAQSAEFQALYPGGMSNREFVRTIYNNAFDRDPDAGGWDYWTRILDATDASDLAARGAFVGAVVLGAYSATSGPRDEGFLTNRHEVALSYLNRLLEQPQELADGAVNALLQRVTDDDATVSAAESLLDFVFEDVITLTGVMTDQNLVDGFFG